MAIVEHGMRNVSLSDSSKPFIGLGIMNENYGFLPYIGVID